MKVFPLVSVVMSVYNGEKYLSKSIESILNQTFTDFEFIIIDDGSSDTSLDIINSYSDSRIIVIKQENMGLAKALNNGLNIAKGSFIARIDADDMAKPERLAKEYAFLSSHSDYVLVGSNAEVIDEFGQYVFTSSLPNKWEEIQSVLLKNPFYHSSVLYRKDVAEKCGYYYEPVRQFFEDVILWNKMALHGKMTNLEESLVIYRLVPDAITLKSKNSSLVNEILKKILGNESLNANDFEKLVKEKTSETLKIKKYHYHLYIAKKLLWNNYRPVDARYHCIKAIFIFPFKLYPFILLSLSIFPFPIIRILYVTLKKLIKNVWNYRLFIS